MNILHACIIIFALVARGSALLRRVRPTVEVSSVLQNDVAPLDDKLEEIKGEIQKIKYMKSSPQVILPDTSVSNAIARHDILKDNENTREETIDDMQTRDHDAEREGKIKGNAKALLQEGVKEGKDLAQFERAQHTVEKENEKVDEEVEDEIELDAEKEEEEEKEEDEKEEKAAETTDKQVVTDNDTQLEESISEYIDKASDSVSKAEENTVEELEAEKELLVSDSDSDAEVDEPESSLITNIGSTNPSEKKPEVETKDSGTTNTSHTGSVTGVMDQPATCIEEMMMEPCPPMEEAKTGGQASACNEILAKTAAEEKLAGAEETIKKIIKHKNMKGGPVIVKRSHSTRTEEEKEEEEEGDEDET